MSPSAATILLPPEEMAAIGKTLPSVPTAGFYTYGEFARVRGASGFHNQTLVTLAIG